MLPGGKWACCEIFSLHSLYKLVEDVKVKGMVEPVEEYPYPDFGAQQLQESALTQLCGELEVQTHNIVSSTRNLPSVLIANKMLYVWTEVLTSFHDMYSSSNIRNDLAHLKKEIISNGHTVGSERSCVEGLEDKVTGNAVLVELGIKTSLSMVFTLLKQSWSQVEWNKQLFLTLSQVPGLDVPPLMSTTSPVINLPNEILKLVLDVLLEIPSLSLSNSKSLSHLSWTCLNQSTVFLEWAISPASNVDAQGKTLALQILLSLSMHYGSLIDLLDWVDKVLTVVVDYSSSNQVLPHLSLSAEYCQSVLTEISARTVG